MLQTFCDEIRWLWNLQRGNVTPASAQDIFAMFVRIFQTESGFLNLQPDSAHVTL